MATDGAGQVTDRSAPAARPKRAVRVGVVASAERDKTIAVAVPYTVRHPKYGRYSRRQTVLHAHDEQNQAGAGDLVEVAECRPISKTKHWRLVRIVRKAERGAAP